ncbi:hypothetical protein HY496_01720 [Candidatus Woesearchaeota archaeon]|nr:hypothetical protein [Candidatus Woesearchaeota archaeon]
MLFRWLLEGLPALAGAVKGYSDATGHPIDPLYLLYVGAPVSIVKGALNGMFIKVYNLLDEEERRAEWRQIIAEEMGDELSADDLEKIVREQTTYQDKRFLGKKPVHEGTKTMVLALPVVAVETTAGYVLGYLIGKMVR